MSHLSNFPVVNGQIVAKVVSQAQVDAIKNLKLFPDDTWVVTYPKCGTTWAQQIVKLILSKGEDDGKKINEAVPWIEAANNPDPNLDYKVDISALQSPRAFKSHFAYDRMPCGLPSSTTCKYIYVARNPKDVAVSYFHHHLGFKYVAELCWEDYISWFLSGQVPFEDYFDHVLSWWAHKDDDNVLFIKYEDMKKDLQSSIKQISEFMSHKLSKEIIEKIAEKSSFNSMKDDPGANYTWASHRRNPDAVPFMRKGVVGNWMEYFSPEQSSRCDAIYAKKFKPVGLEFEFE